MYVANPFPALVIYGTIKHHIKPSLLLHFNLRVEDNYPSGLAPLCPLMKGSTLIVEILS